MGDKDINLLVTMRPITFFIILTIAVLLLPSIVIPQWYERVKKIEHHVEMETSYAQYELMSKIEDTAKLVVPISSSANNLSSILGPVLNEPLLFSDIQNKVAPALFEAQVMVPHLVEASYIGLDGLFFSYIKIDNKTCAVYSNSSYFSKASNVGYTWYSRLVKSSTGELYEEAKLVNPLILVNETWFKQVMNNPNSTYASLGYQWTDSERKTPTFFVNTATLGGHGAISLGFSIQGVIDQFSSIDLSGAMLYMATLDDGKVLLEGSNKEVNIEIRGDKALVHNERKMEHVIEVQCTSNTSVTTRTSTIVDINGADYAFYCSIIDIVRVPSVYVLAFPSKRFLRDVQEQTNMALILLILMMVGMVISVIAFVVLIARATQRELHLRAAYMRQIEKTNQAEQKRMRQSVTFASANHDVRGYIACIKGFIELIHNQTSPSSELASDLKKIDNCAEDLLELVNSILDFSKMEAGKMELEDEDFDLAQLLEDLADLHHLVAMKKGVDVILDHSDGSIMKFSKVKGDPGKLKQILNNLLSNAVKFTTQGHICIRASVKRPSFENTIPASNENRFLDRLSRVFLKNKKPVDNVQERKTLKHDPNCMEFVFEVEDTGSGIPKEKRASIFENFVQVKDSSTGQVGTGLGLGIVQSLVRLMGGDIAVVDRANGERGTCFKFNIFLVVQDNATDDRLRELEMIQFEDTYTNNGVTSSSRNPRVQNGSVVVLLIKNDARRRVVSKYMENLGLKLLILRQVNNLSRALKKMIAPKLNASPYYSSSSGGNGAFLSSGSDRIEVVPVSMTDRDDILPVYKRLSFRGPIKCILLVLDANAGNFHELCRSVSDFRRDVQRTCVKVVWLERSDTRRAHFPGLNDDDLSPNDCIISQPLHGSRLKQVVALLPEFGGTATIVPRERRSNGVVINNNMPQSETEDFGTSDSSNEDQVSSLRNTNLDVIFIDNIGSSTEGLASRTIEIHEIISGRSDAISQSQNVEVAVVPSPDKPLKGKKFLLAEDVDLLRKLAETFLTRLGAHVDVCGNGQEAFELIYRALNGLEGAGSSKFPYDYVLMDCQMPIMDGMEATKRIRVEEKKYGMHIPIIALTAFESRDEEEEIVEAGMDFVLNKPLNKDKLVETLGKVNWEVQTN